MQKRVLYVVLCLLFVLVYLYLYLHDGVFADRLTDVLALFVYALTLTTIILLFRRFQCNVLIYTGWLSSIAGIGTLLYLFSNDSELFNYAKFFGGFDKILCWDYFRAVEAAGYCIAFIYGCRRSLRHRGLWTMVLAAATFIAVIYAAFWQFLSLSVANQYFDAAAEAVNTILFLLVAIFVYRSRCRLPQFLWKMYLSLALLKAGTDFCYMMSSGSRGYLDFFALILFIISLINQYALFVRCGLLVLTFGSLEQSLYDPDDCQLNSASAQELNHNVNAFNKKYMMDEIARACEKGEVFSVLSIKAVAENGGPAGGNLPDGLPEELELLLRRNLAGKYTVAYTGDGEFIALLHYVAAQQAAEAARAVKVILENHTYGENEDILINIDMRLTTSRAGESGTDIAARISRACQR